MNIFVSYSHKDTKFKNRLITHLRAFREENAIDRIDLWHEKKIGAGNDWRTEIDNALKRANAAILLISADFLASDFICHKEVPVFLERRAEEGLRMIPVIIKPCPWKKISWLSAMQAIHLSDRNTDSSGWFSNLVGFIFKNREMEKDCAFAAEKIHEALRLGKSDIPQATFQKPEKTKAGTLSINAPIFIEIKAYKDLYTGQIHQGDPEKIFPLSEIKLNRDTTPLDNNPITLGEITDSIIKFEPKKLEKFNERVQLDLGRYLYDQTLGRLPEKERNYLHSAKAPKEIDMRILTDDEHIAGLP
jgi:hypothetical protein